MYALNNLKEVKKDEDNHSDTKYTVLGSSASTTTETRNLKPPLWNTLEFYIYYAIVVISAAYSFYVGYRISKGI